MHLFSETYDMGSFEIGSQQISVGFTCPPPNNFNEDAHMTVRNTLLTAWILRPKKLA
jgi:hypothetical protein